MSHTVENTTEEFNAVCSRLWFEHCNAQGWPNDLPAWSELREFKAPEWVMIRQEFEAMAAGVMEVCDHYHKQREGA